MKVKLVFLTVVVAGSMQAAMPAFAQSYRWGGEEPERRYVRPYRTYEAPQPWIRGDERRQVWREPLPPARTYNDRRWLPQPIDEDDEEIDQRPVPATPIAPYQRQRAYDEPPSANLRDGGPRPPVQPQPPQIIPFAGPYAPGTVVIDTKGRQLLLITSSRAALRYPISVGREGFQWTGSEKISRMADWPDWHPPSEMRKRDPSLPEKMTGGIRNPLGAKALYLGNTLYRIHGTNDARTVGHASSSGCFRMLNGHVVDLSERVKIGTPVVVVDRLPRGSIAEPGRDTPSGYDRQRARYSRYE